MSVIGNNVGIGKLFGSNPSTITADSGLTKLKTENSAKDEFMALMDKSPAERMREILMQQLGVTEEDLKNMSPEDLEKFEQKLQDLIKEKVKQAMEQQKGQDVPGGLFASFIA